VQNTARGKETEARKGGNIPDISYTEPSTLRKHPTASFVRLRFRDFRFLMSDGVSKPA
jgi:hypothetical protein